MVKKRFKIAIFLVTAVFLTLLFSRITLAGCCIGVTGCSRAFLDTECPVGISTFSPAECEDEPDCNVVACCHQIAGIPTATYRSTCQQMSPTPGMIDVGPFITDPTFEETYAKSLCGGAVPSCSYVNCEQPNAGACQCGSSQTSTTNPYCCGLDSATFTSDGSCRASSSCSIGQFFDVSGLVLTPQGLPIAGATVRAGGKQTITDFEGKFNVTQLPDLSTGSIVAIKNNSINSTTYTISSAHVSGITITLVVSALPQKGLEDCTNGWDDDLDQFGWNSTLLESPDFAMAADWCDNDCPAKPGDNPLIKVRNSVSRTYYRYDNEWGSQSEDFCSDNIDNDCDGKTDCEDDECAANSPACKQTFCGDAVVQFPNALGEFEQCDINYTGQGDDSLCPGKCIPAGQPNQCHCLYEAVCGNNVIDEPLEDCDGSFIASQNIWDPAEYNAGSDCTIDMCGTPNSNRPCQCPPPQECGNGVIEDPEECDLGNPGAGIEPASGNCDGCSPDCRCPPEPVVCGNNIIEYGEDCDGNYDPFANDGEGEWTDFKIRKFGCTRDTCAPPKEKWLENVNHQPADYDLLLEDLKTIGECTCPTVCSLGPTGPNITGISHTQYKRELNIDWTDECINENLETYNVLRCEASDASGTGCEEGAGTWTTINSAPLGITQNYVDTDFQGSRENMDKYYCYRVEGIYDTLQIQSRSVLSPFNPEINCVKAGREECFAFRDYYPDADEFCVSNIRSNCDENNSITRVEDTKKVDCNDAEQVAGIWTDFVCVGPYPNAPDKGKTKCVPKSACDYCADPFGLFSYSRSAGGLEGQMELLDSLGDFGDYGKAPQHIGDPRDTWEECYAIDFCYMDYSKTSANVYYPRTDDMSCYDYRSEEACIRDKEQVGNCEWAPHPEYAELGIGVCRTTIIEEQRCDKCHDPINKVFGKCDMEMCELYGRCYYDKANLLGENWNFSQVAYISLDNPVKKADLGGTSGGEPVYYQCRHERDISCANYDNQDDCENSKASYSRQGTDQMNISVDIDVSGNMSDKNFNKLSGTNELLEGSDDYFNFSKCAWKQNEHYIIKIDPNNASNITETITPFGPAKCVKNSDDNPPWEEHIDGTYQNQTWYRTDDDCEGIDSSIVPNIKDCRKDTTAPSTNLPLYDDARIAGSFDLKATVNDNSLDYAAYSYYPDTYACIAEEDRDCYPSGRADQFGREFGNSIAYDNVNMNLSYIINRSFFNELELLEENETPNIPANLSKNIRSGWYNFKYFSEDISHNIEPVNEYRVFIDSDPPNVVLKFHNNSWEQREDVWRSNLTIEMDIVPRYPEDDKVAMCNAKLYLQNYSIFPLEDIVNEYNNSWSMNYTYLVDDYYTFYYRCEDDVGNVAEEWVDFTVDGDRSITNPIPKKTLAENQIVIGVDTGTNAECRYLESTSDIPAFQQNISFDPNVFNTMIPFDFTGSPDTPTTQHRANVVLPHGYHRFYTKCLMYADNKMVGNNADQIRFAIDNDAPVTDWRVNKAPYNNWYNDNIAVELFCDDHVIQGQGNEWQFGCDLTYYCIGLDCENYDEWHLYTDDIWLDKTNYLSYYSIDKGGNVENINRNVLFQIDKEPANVSISILEGKYPAKVIVLDNVYKIIINSTKPIISPLIESPLLIYNSEPIKFSDTVELFPTENNSVWEGVFRLDNINANRGFEGNLTFEASGHDYHNVHFFSSKDIMIDTKPPNPPYIAPSLVNPTQDASEFETMPYPVNWVDGVYYTNQKYLKITGYTDEYLDIIGVTTVDDIDTEHPFTQTAPSDSTLLQNITLGCCVSQNGCSQATTSDQCPPLSNFLGSSACEQIEACNIVACCHNITGIPKATYKNACEALNPQPEMHPISVFEQNPYVKSNQAEILCGQAFGCNYASCEQPNSLQCACGSTVTNFNNPYCCSGDSGIFSSSENCLSSPSCNPTPVNQPTTPTEKNTFSYQDTVLSGFEGQNQIKVEGDLRNLVTTDHFIGFGEEQLYLGPRTTFGHYGLFYDISSMQYFGGDDMYTLFNVYPPLETSLALGDKISFYPRENPAFWFGLNLVMTPFKNNSFYLKAYDNAGNLVRVPKISDDPAEYVFFYDPNPPKVIAHTPIGGSTSKDTFDMELFLTEGKLESGIDFNNTQFLINEEPVDFNIEITNQTDDDPTNTHYRIFHSATNLDDGTYDIVVDTQDLATNKPDEATAKTSWTVVVDHSLPADPTIRFDGCYKGKDEDSRWYCPQTINGFTVDFSEEQLGKVDILGVMMQSSPSDDQAAVCNETIPGSNIFDCEFKEPKSMKPNFFWADYGIIIKAKKVLSDGTESNVGNYGPFPFTVDTEAPEFTYDFNTRLRDNFNLSISTVVRNEIHPLFAEITLFGQTVTASASSSGIEYNFVLPIPELNKEENEGPTTMILKMMDSAHNVKQVSIPVYIDLTPPSVANLNINISNTVNIAGESFTANPNVTVTGILNDDDVISVWVIPGDYNETSGTFGDKKLGSVRHKIGPAGPACDQTPPVLTIDINNSGLASLGCEDDNSGCTFISSYYGTTSSANCLTNQYFLPPVTIPIVDPVNMCYNLSDVAGNSVFGVVALSLNNTQELSKETTIVQDDPNCDPSDIYDFSVNIRLYDPSAGGVHDAFVYNSMLINQINNMTIVFQDAAGHKSSRRLKIIHDVTAPLEPTFTIS